MTTNPGRPTLLRAVALSREFRTGGGIVRACTDVGLDVGAGELVAVTGKSGAGKSTLLTLLGTLDVPTSGHVEIDGRVVATLTTDGVSALRRESLGFVFQEFALLPVLTAAENVEVPLRLLRTAPAERRARVEEVLEMVGLRDHGDQRPDELSGGQQQRVAIARALAARPRILIADEPTGQLDEENAALVIGLLRELSSASGVTVVVATHDPRFVEVADQHLHLVDGKPTG